MSIDDTDPYKHLDIPAFLKRQKEPDPTENFGSKGREKTMEAEQIAESEETVTAKPPKAKANGHAKDDKPAKKAASKDKAKAKAGKTAKAAEKSKAKATKPKAEAKPKAEKDQFGLRKGSAKSEAATLYARKSGATLEEVKERVGSIQLNVLKELEADGYEVRQEKQERKGKRPITRYWLSPKK